MPNPVSPFDVAERWRPLSETELALTTVLLDDAWSYLKARVATLEDRVTAGTLDTGIVTAVVAAMVLRVLKNPDGKSEESIDDYRYRRDTAVSAGMLYATSDELALLRPPSTALTGGSVRLVAYGEL